jgi:hypothetical protein
VPPKDELNVADLPGSKQRPLEVEIAPQSSTLFRLRLRDKAANTPLGVVSKHIYSHRPNADKSKRGPWVSAAGIRARSSRGVGVVAAGKLVRYPSRVVEAGSKRVEFHHKSIISILADIRKSNSNSL